MSKRARMDADVSTATTLAAAVASRLVVLVVSAVVVLVVQRLLSNEPLLPPEWTGSGGGTRRDPRVDAMVTVPDARHRLSDVGGYADAKEELVSSVVVPLRNPGVFYASGLRSVKPPSGVLLHGPPGTGKTMLARAVAAEANVPLITLHSAALESKWWGDSPKLMQAVFTQARTRYAPCIIFMDEIDGLGRARSESDQSCVYSFKCEMLRNMDSVRDDPVAVLACTNCPRSLDPALARRFQRKVEVPRPTLEERAAILALLLDQEHADSVAPDALARRTAGFTGADLGSLYEAACSSRLARAGRRAERARSARDLVRALGPLTEDDVRRGATRISKPLVADDDEDVPTPDAPPSPPPRRSRERDA